MKRSKIVEKLSDLNIVLPSGETLSNETLAKMLTKAKAATNPAKCVTSPFTLSIIRRPMPAICTVG